MADYLSPTPYANPLTGLSNDMIQGLLGYMKDKQRTQQMQGLAGLLESTGIPQTVERAAYAQSPKALLDTLTNVNRANVPLLKAETADALMNIAPMVGPAARGAERAAMAAGRAGERYAEKVVPQIMEQGGLPAQLLGDLSQGSIRPMDVWHGSPHGPFTKFDPTKIGSGEGAQAFSYGHYLGEARGTGEGYRKDLTNKVRPKELSVGIENTAWQTVRNAPDWPDEKLVSYVKNAFPNSSDSEIQQAISKARDHLEQGYLYKVDLPDEAIANMLDWDKPVSKQPNVMNALRSEAEQRVKSQKLADIENDIRGSLPAQDVGDDYLAMFSDANVGINQDIQKQALEKLNKMDLKPLIDKELDNMKPVDMNWNMTGKQFYELLSTREGSPEKASGLLQRQGVPGTRYLDAGSRTPGGSDTSNFVVYPGGEDLLTIKEINDKPIGGLLGQSKAAFAYPQEEAMRLAQQRAALPISEGGLGLKPNNTAAEREAVMFPLKAYRGVTGDVESSVMPSDFFGSNYFGKGINITTSPQDASKYASTDVGVNHDLVGKAELMSQKLGISYPEAKAELTRGGGAVMPISANIDNPLVVGMQKIQAPDSMIRYALNEAGYSGNVDKLVNQFKNANTGIEQFKLMQENQATPFYRSMSSLMNKNGLMIDPSLSPKSEGGMHYLATDPDQIRSRFAAFDPFRRTAAIAAAMGVAAPDLLAKEQKPKKKKSLLD